MTTQQSRRSEPFHVLKSTLSEDGSYYIISGKGHGFVIKSKYGVIPKEGDTGTLHTIGSLITGIELNGVMLFYKTDEQLEQDRIEQSIKYQKEKEEAFAKNEANLNASYEKLPPIFKKRIDRFRENNPSFRVDYESYEMFCCEQAVVIAEAMKTVEAIDDFYKLSYEDQKKLVPGLEDGHSGNTFGCACLLAKLYISQPENVAKANGALAPLVGSEEYGDVKKQQ